MFNVVFSLYNFKIISEILLFLPSILFAISLHNTIFNFETRTEIKILMMQWNGHQNMIM